MNLSNFAERLKDLISEAETNPTKLSAELNLANATVSHYTTGRYLPTVEITIRLADYFHVTCDYLLGIDEENRAHEFNVCPPFGERLIAVCKQCKISRYKLRQATGISETAMRYWLSGKTNPTIENVVKIAKALGCTVDFVLGREK